MGLLLPLNYRRPAYVKRPRSNGSNDSDISRTSSQVTPDAASEKSAERTDRSVRSGSSISTGGIPAALSFDKIIEGGTCPVSLLDDYHDDLS